MSFESSKYIYPKGTFSGGVVTNTPNTHLDPQFTPYGRNFRLDGQAVINRPGHALFATVEGTTYPRGIFSYLRASAANDRIVVRQNVDSTHKLVSITEAGVQTNILTNSDITVDTRMISINIGDVLYLMNGTNFGKLVGTTYTDLPVSGTHLPSAPSFGTFFAGCSWVGGFGSTDSNKVYKSPTNSFEDFTASGADVFTFPETVTGMVTTSQAIFVFTKNTVSVCDIGSQVQTAGVITFSFRTLQSTEGSTNHASLCAVGSDVYYISPSNSINKIVRGNNVYGFEVISLSQRKYKGINNIAELLVLNQTECHSQSFPQQNLVKWFFQRNGSTITDYCIVYDVVRDMFILDTNKFFYDECFFHGYVYAVSNITPTVFIDEYGADDAGSGISFEYWTKAFDEGEATLKKCYWESRTDVAISALASLTQEVWINSEVNVNGNFQGRLADTLTVDSTSIEEEAGGIGTEMIGTYPIGEEGVSEFDMYGLALLRTRGNLNVKGKSIQFRFTCNVVGSQVRLMRIGYKMEVLPPITTDLTQIAVAYLLTEAGLVLATELGNKFIV